MKMKEYVKLLRISHWYKNITVVFGIVMAIIFVGIKDYSDVFRIDILLEELKLYILNSDFLILSVALVFLACIISSSNYIINAICDIEYDKLHIIKKKRPLPSGKIEVKSAYLLLLMITSFGLFASLLFSNKIRFYLLLLLIAGILYNIKPIRLKDVPYIDVISESINNPIRFLIGWSLVSLAFPNIFLIIFTWTMGALLMTIKRYIEIKRDYKTIVKYRKVFEHYKDNSLIFSIMIYSVINIILFILFMISII